MIAPYFLPRRRVGALRPFKFAIHLKEYGWEPHILTIDSNGQLTQKEQQLLGDVSIYSLSPPFDRTNRSGSELGKSNNNSGNDVFKVGDWIDKHFPVDTWLLFFYIKLGEIKRIARQVNPNALWSTGDPWSAHWIGKKISSMLSDIFWMADFRDPWTLSDTDLKQRSAFASFFDRQIERKWIQEPSMLSFTSNSTRKLYEDYYSDLNLNTTTIFNAFDRELFSYESTKTLNLKMNPRKLNLMFFGRFRRLSTAKPVINILSRLKEIDSSVARKISIHSFGPLTDSDNQYLLRKGVGECFEIQDPVPAEQSLQVLQQADILLLSTNPERTDIIPAKLWDYIAAGKPILSIAPNPEIEEILSDIGVGVQYNQESISKVARLLQRCVTAKEDGADLPIPFSRDSKKIDKYSARSTTARLTAILDQHTG